MKIQKNKNNKNQTTMKTTLSILVAMMVSFATMACSNDDAVTPASQARTQAGFYGLVLASDINVVLTQGENQSVIVDAMKADLPFINTKVINGSLVVSVRSKHKLHGPV